MLYSEIEDTMHLDFEMTYLVNIMMRLFFPVEIQIFKWNVVRNRAADYTYAMYIVFRQNSKCNIEAG